MKSYPRQFYPRPLKTELLEILILINIPHSSALKTNRAKKFNKASRKPKRLPRQPLICLRVHKGQELKEKVDSQQQRAKTLNKENGALFITMFDRQCVVLNGHYFGPAVRAGDVTHHLAAHLLTNCNVPY